MSCVYKNDIELIKKTISNESLRFTFYKYFYKYKNNNIKTKNRTLKALKLQMLKTQLR